MNETRTLPIGTDDFRKLRENNAYYADKTLMIKDFIEMQDEVALVTRPRRFGKTINVTMLREFFDITKDSRDIFNGLAIMDTEYAGQINSRPVIYFTFKDCKGATAEELLFLVKQKLYQEYLRYEKLLRNKIDMDSFETKDFYEMIHVLRNPESYQAYYSLSIQQLTQFVKNGYGIAPILLIDEYDQPIMSSYEYGYHEQLGPFFSNLYGSAMKGNPSLDQALLTGVQRVAKESIFSQFNNPQVYTAVSNEYAPYFGLSEDETRELLETYGLELNDKVRSMYDGYQFGGIRMYNPWSIINYAKNGRLESYWVKTSANFLVKTALKEADRSFWSTFEHLITGKEEMVWIMLDTSFAERASLYSLWGLLVNAGYLTVTQWVDAKSCMVKIPNEEVMSEFQLLVSKLLGFKG